MSGRGYRPNVTAIVRDREGRILLCERSDYPGSWGFPQGGIQEGEELAEAMGRRRGASRPTKGPNSPPRARKRRPRFR